MTTYAFTLDGLVFSERARFLRGPVIYYQPQIWSSMTPIGATATAPAIDTFIGLGNQYWDCGKDGLFTTAEKDKLLALYNARSTVVWKTPQDTTGINVRVTSPFTIESAEPGPNSLFRVTFRLKRRP